MLFKIDFTRPHLYEDVVTLNQGNLSTNNTLRCKVVTGGNDDVTGASIVCTFVINGKQVFESGKVVDGPRGIVDVIFPSEALVVGENTLEFLVNRIDGSVAQSPIIKYRVWQGLTTDEGVRADSNYPLLVELINQANSAVNSANEALECANSVIARGDELKASVDKLKADCIASVNSFTEENSAKIDNVITQNVAKIDAAIVKNEASIVKADAAAEKAILAANNSDTKTTENIKNVNAAIAAGTQDLEVKAARVDMDGKEHGSLKERLESDLKKGKLIEETKEGTYLSFNDTVEGIVSDIEVFGNTVQDASNLANIKSSCTPNGDGTFKMSILSCGENLFNGKWQHDTSINAQGQLVFSNDRSTSLDYIKVSQNEKISCFSDRGGFNNVYCFDSKLNYLGIATYNATTIVTMPNTCYIKINIVKSGVNYDKFSVYKGEYKAVYTPYQETRCDIKLPCQLEKWDRLYFDKVENDWCIEDGSSDYVSDGSKIISISASLQNVNSFELNGLSIDICLGGWSTIESISSKFKCVPFSTISTKDEECFAMTESNGKVNIRINVLKNKASTVEDFKNIITGTLFKYQLKTPQKIVLPQSEQIKLNSFANKTHIYTISGDVDATVKATVSKSLASTVQANTEEISKINNTIADIQGLKESQDFEYETDKGYLVCKDTQNGVVKDLKVYGKSLVNDGGAVNKEFTQFSVILNSKKMLTPNKEYTLIIENKTNTDLIVYTAEEAIVPTQNINLKANSTTMKKIVSQSTVNSLRLLKSNTPNSNLFNLNVLLLEGDHTQNPPQYFEGIASVGNGNEIEVLSNNENYFNFNNFYYKKDTISYEIVDSNTIKVSKVNGASYDYTGFRVKLIPNKKYSIGADLSMSDNCGIGIKDVNGNGLVGDVTVIANKREFVTPPDGIVEVRFYPTLGTTGNATMVANNIYIKSFENINNFVKTKQAKKPILFKDTDGAWKPITELRGIDLNRCDTIENGKYNVKTNKTVLNGEGDYYLSTGVGTQTNTIMLGLRGVPFKKPTDDKLKNHFLCSNANQLSGAQTWNEDVEGVSLSINGIIFIRLNKSKATDLASGKEYLKNNPIPLIYLTNEVKEYEVNPLDLESFENETMISFGSGVIAPYASWKITSSLPNFVQNIEDRVCRLENDAYKVNLANFAVALNMLDMKARLESLEAPIN